MLEYFTPNLIGEPKYNLNNPLVMDKFMELFMTYFSEGTLHEKIPGHTHSLFSGVGMKVIKKVLSIDKETGQPDSWEVMRTDEWKAKEKKPKLVKEDYDNIEDRTFVGLKVGEGKLGWNIWFRIYSSSSF